MIKTRVQDQGIARPRQDQDQTNKVYLGSQHVANIHQIPLSHTPTCVICLRVFVKENRKGLLITMTKTHFILLHLKPVYIDHNNDVNKFIRQCNNKNKKCS